MVSETPDRGLANRSAAKAEAALLAEHGIVRVPADAIVQARRTREARR
jgi:hypothetical protein